MEYQPQLLDQAQGQGLVPPNEEITEVREPGSRESDQRSGDCKYNNHKKPKFTKNDLIILPENDGNSFFNAVAYGIACLGYIINHDGSGLSFSDKFQNELPNPNVNRASTVNFIDIYKFILSCLNIY